MRPVIVIDGTHLKGKGKGVLFIAATKDGNEQLYPLAYGVGPKENDESWKWFLQRLKSAYGGAPPLLVVSDAHVSIGNAVREVLPHATHGLCYYHLQKKMRAISDEVWKAFRRAAYSYEKSDCDDWMRKIRSVNPTAYERLKSIGEERWSRSHCHVKRYSFMTSNAAESFNSSLLSPWALSRGLCKANI